jgi:hypothetical protein
MPPKKGKKGKDKGGKTELQLLKDDEARKKLMEEAKTQARVRVYWMPLGMVDKEKAYFYSLIKRSDNAWKRNTRI